MSGAPADPAAATVSPSTERARTPARLGLRVGRRPPEPVQMHPEITGRIEEELQAVNPSLQAAIAAVVQVEPEEPTDPGETAPAQQEVWKWHDPYLELAPAARQLAYLAHMCELMERAEHRYQQQDPRDPVLGEALERAQEHFGGGKRTRDQLIRKGVAVGLDAVGGVTSGKRLTPAAVLSGIAGFGLAASIALFGFVLDHLDVLIALARGL